MFDVIIPNIDNLPEEVYANQLFESSEKILDRIIKKQEEEKIMTQIEIKDKLNAIKKAGVVIKATSIIISRPQIHISLDSEVGGEVLYNPLMHPVHEWVGRVYNAMKAVGLIN